MSDQERRELGEKEEKEEEKHEKEGEKEEKSWDEKWRRDPLSAVVWAAILIWAGLVLLAGNLDLLAFLPELETWSLIFAGAGVIVLMEVVIRLLVPEYRQPVIGTLIFGFVLLGIAVGDLIGWGLIGALIVIAIGLSILVRGLFWRR